MAATDALQGILQNPISLYQLLPVAFLLSDHDALLKASCDAPVWRA